MVYLIRAPEVGRVKIGVAGGEYGPQRRLTSLQTGSPVKLELVAVIGSDDSQDEYELEAHLHQRYADKRLHGEWFDDSVIDEIVAEYDAERCRAMVGAREAAKLERRRLELTETLRRSEAELEYWGDDNVMRARRQAREQILESKRELLSIASRLGQAA